jgi:hypothetical protein
MDNGYNMVHGKFAWHIWIHVAGAEILLLIAANVAGWNACPDTVKR